MLDSFSIKLSQTANTFKAYKKANTFKVTFAKEAGTIEIASGSLRYFKEDAIISGFDGEAWPVNRQYFDGSYTPISPTTMGEDGDYQANPIEIYALALTEENRVIMHSGDTLTGKPGDYLVQYPNGDYGIIAEHLFKQFYQKNNPISLEKTTNFDIFVSYSTKNKQFVDALVYKLEQNNIRCWYAPRDIPIGMEWPQAITTAIRDSKLMLLIFSEHSNISPEIARELTLASNHNCSVIPVRVDDVMPSEKLAYHLANRHWLDIHGQKTEQAVETILDGLQKLAGQLPLFKAKPASKSKTLKYTLSALLAVVCLAIVINIIPKWVQYRTEAAELVKYEDSIILIYTGENGFQVKLMQYDKKKDTYLIQANNFFHPDNKYIFECSSVPPGRPGDLIFRTFIDGEKYTPLYISGNYAHFWPHNANVDGKIKITYNEALSSKADPKEFVREYRKQLNRTSQPE